MASAIPDYDEDVILPSSPLSQYLHELESLESDAFTESEESSEIKNDVSQSSFNIRDKLSLLEQTILESLKQYLSFIYNIFVPCLIPFEYSEFKCILHIVKKSKILVPEDLSVLLNYEADDESNAELKLSYSSVFQQCFQLFAFVLIYMIMRSITISNIIKNEDLHTLFSDKSYFICILVQFLLLLISVALYVNIFIISAFIVTNFTKLILCKVFCRSIKKKFRTTESIMMMIKKCVRLIQEAELIARGFTSASVPGIVERLELSTGLPINSPQRQYPELRKCIFSWTRDMFMLYKNSTQKLIESKKFGPVLDFSSQSFAMLDLKEFGNLLKYDINFNSDLDELLKLTDGLSVSSLKTMYLLLEIQVSEFYKYLYLITSFLISDDNLFNCMKKINYFYSLNSFVESLQKSDVDVLKVSCETHKYYKSFEAITNTVEKPSTVQKSATSNLEMCVHNMSLHLKAALKRVANLEELLEQERKSNEFNSENCLRKVDKMMKEIRSEVEAYQDYYLKCDCEVQTVLYGEKQSFSDIDQRKNAEEKDEICKPTVITTCDSDPVIEDEIFVAIVTKSSQEKDFFPEEYPVETHKHNFEVTGKLLHELKNVLTVKADEHRIREEKAMAKKMKRNELETLEEKNSSEEVKLVPKDGTPESELFNEEAFSDSSLSDFDISRNVASYNDADKVVHCESDTDKFQTFPLTNKNTFAASIASLALQRQKKMGITDDVCFSDSNDSDEEMISS